VQQLRLHLELELACPTTAAACRHCHSTASTPTAAAVTSATGCADKASTLCCCVPLPSAGSTDRPMLTVLPPGPQRQPTQLVPAHMTHP
jgi:hypothetical protein